MFRREDIQFFALAFALALVMHACEWAVNESFVDWSEQFNRKESIALELPAPQLAVIKLPATIIKPEIDDTTRLQRCKRSGECSKLAEALVYEARGESLAGSIAVGYVIVERTKDPSRWPKTVRGVVSQKNQFSYTTRRQKIRPNDEDWQRAYITSYQILHGEVSNPIGSSDHYHTIKVKPKWAKKMQYVATLGSHRFYKEIECP